jgi:hypothetical protein
LTYSTPARVSRAVHARLVHKIKRAKRALREALDIGTRFAYKECNRSRKGNLKWRPKSMATRKGLKKAKKIVAKKSLRWDYK